MKEIEYDKYYFQFKQTGQIDAIIIQEFLTDIGEKFDLNQFFHVLQILNNPFSAMNPELQPYLGIDYQKIMIDKCFNYYDKKFDKHRYDLTFTQISDKRLLKTLLQKYPQGVIHF